MVLQNARVSSHIRNGEVNMSYVCPCCGYTPDEEELKEWSTVTCCKCGDEVCDLCAFIGFKELKERDSEWIAGHWTCAKCGGIEPMGQYRKELLAEESGWESEDIPE